MLREEGWSKKVSSYKKYKDKSHLTKHLIQPPLQTGGAQESSAVVDGGEEGEQDEDAGGGKDGGEIDMDNKNVIFIKQASMQCTAVQRSWNLQNWSDYIAIRMKSEWRRRKSEEGLLKKKDREFSSRMWKGWSATYQRVFSLRFFLLFFHFCQSFTWCSCIHLDGCGDVGRPIEDHLQ